MAENIKNVFIIDASFMLSYLLPDEGNKEVKDFFTSLKDQNIYLISSPLFYFEVINGLLSAIKVHRISAQTAKKLAQNLLKLEIKLGEINYLKIFELAVKNKLTFYDASYLYLARSQSLPLLTLDQHLAHLNSN